MTVGTLKSAIYNKYPSVAACADALGWSRQRLHKIANGKKTPDVFEVQAIAEVLQEPIGDVALLFLPDSSPNGQQTA